MRFKKLLIDAKHNSESHIGCGQRSESSQTGGKRKKGDFLASKAFYKQFEAFFKPRSV